MSIKLVILKSGDTLIADAKELIIGEEENNKIVGYLLTNPYKVTYQKSLLLTEDVSDSDSMVEITMSPWILLTSDTSIPIKPDWVVTVVEPLESVKTMYTEKLNAFNEQSDQGATSES